MAAAAVGLRAVPPASGAPTERTGPPSAAPVLSVRRVPVLLATPAADRRLREGLAEVTAGLPASSCLEVGNGRGTLFAVDPAASVAPASTLKLVTAATALTHLGPTTELRTTVRADPPVDGVVAGDLWLVGGGDPVLGTATWEATFDGDEVGLRTSIEALADQVAAGGIRSVQGSVVGDDSRYDAERYVASWPSRYGSQGVVGPLSALTVDDGFTGWGGTAPKAFANPPLGAAGLFTVLLRQRGVEVVGDPGVGRAPIEETTEVAAIASPPVAELVAAMLVDSDNGTAELLTKEVGHVVAGDGSTAAGAAVAESTLAALGLPMAGVDVVDGSGLDRANRLTCRLLYDLLATLGPNGVIAGSLPVAGASGTLADRFVGSPAAGHLRAKTGTLNDVSALAGYADTTDAGELTFAVVVNGAPSVAAALQSAVAERLVAYDLAPLDELGPDSWPGLAPAGP